jgi:hypothetical protein
MWVKRSPEGEGIPCLCRSVRHQVLVLHSQVVYNGLAFSERPCRAEALGT